MYETNLGPLLEAFNAVATFAQTAASNRNSAHPGMKIDRRSWDLFKQEIVKLKEIGEAADFPILVDYAEKFLGEMQLIEISQADPIVLHPSNIVVMASGALQVQESVKANLRVTHAILLDSHSVKFWAPKNPPFGKTFQDQFPSAQYDLDEAAKCLALGRYAGSVFHLMRVMEAGLGALHACLGINVPLQGNDRNWGNILRRVRDEIAAKKKWAEKDAFQEFYALLDSVKDAWRNSTMHVDKKVTPDDADRIYTTVHGFMTKLSARMDENGEPKV